MIQPHSSPGWESEQQRWSAWYAERLPQQLRDVAAHVRVQRRTPGRLFSHFASCLSLLRRTAAFETFDEAWLALVEALHPLPKRWG